MFGNLIGKSSVPLTGLSQSTSSVAPNIDFYLLLDNSPSMAIAATTAGINTMVANTHDQCAFACHESDKSPNDYYGLARSLGVTLRMDLLRQATQNLMTTAQAAETNNNASYRAAIYTFNIGFTPQTNPDIANKLHRWNWDFLCDNVPMNAHDAESKFLCCLIRGISVRHTDNYY